MNPKAVKIVALCSAVVLLIFSVVYFSLISYITDGASFSCNNKKSETKVSGRTAGMGITSAFLGGVVALLALPIFCCFDTGRPNSVFKLCLMPLALLAWLFFLIAWALLAKDITDFHHLYAEKMAYCNMPTSWAISLVFGILSWVAAAAVTLMCIASWSVGKHYPELFAYD